LVEIFNYNVETLTVLFCFNHENSYVSFAKFSVQALDLKTVDQILVLTKFNPVSHFLAKSLDSLIIHGILLVKNDQVF
jgi:acetolactate synthase small subunit